MNKNTIILFSKGEADQWTGLPENLLIGDLSAVFGPPAHVCETVLGYYPATKYSFKIDKREEGLVAYERNGLIILIETMTLPSNELLNELPAPDAVLPDEILAEKAYAAEYVYSGIGLNLTVAKHFDKTVPDKIIRCRGVKKLNNPSEFDARYYKSFDDLTLLQDFKMHR